MGWISCSTASSDEASSESQSQEQMGPCSCQEKQNSEVERLRLKRKRTPKRAKDRNLSVNNYEKVRKKHSYTNSESSTESDTLHGFCECATEDETDRDSRELSDTWKFDQDASRRALATMIINDELSFALVKNEEFQKFMSAVCPQFVVPSRSTTTRDCLELYSSEKAKFKAFFNENKQMVSLTCDMWTSDQGVKYLCLTSHYIDDDWKLCKKILDFIPYRSHKRDDIGLLIEKCLDEWGIKKVLSITMEDASWNNNIVDYFAQRFASTGMTILEGQHWHIKCVAHIINLVMRDSLSDFTSSIDRIRTVVRYVKKSPKRLKKFEDFVVEEKIESRKSLHIDVPTRWDSVYLMLETATIFQSVFQRYEISDADFLGAFMPGGTHGDIGLPTKEDWSIATGLVNVMGQFYSLTKRVSRTQYQYVTSTIIFEDVCDAYAIMKEMMPSTDKDLAEIATRMKTQFDKYWGNIEATSMLLFVSVILDPRLKFGYVEFSLKSMYGDDLGTRMANMAKDALSRLFNEYNRVYVSPPTSPISTIDSTPNLSEAERALQTVRLAKRMLIYSRVRDMERGRELEKYLGERIEPYKHDFDLLGWWKESSRRYTILPRLARDLLAIPISTMTSEFVFSARGRVLSDFTSPLTPKTTQALISGQDWLCQKPLNSMEEDLESSQTVEDA